MSRFIHLAMGAGKEAVADSGIDFAAMTPGAARPGRRRRQHRRWRDRADHRRHPRPRPEGAALVSPSPCRRYRARWARRCCRWSGGLTGPVITQVAACATSVIAFHDALRFIRDGDCDVVITGGTEAPIWPMGVAALANMTALSKRNDEPESASRPFDLTRDGFVLGEGAGISVVESLEHARERGARRSPRSSAVRLTADAFHISAGADRAGPGPLDDQRHAP